MISGWSVASNTCRAAGLSSQAANSRAGCGSGALLGMVNAYLITPPANTGLMPAKRCDASLTATLL